MKKHKKIQIILLLIALVLLISGGIFFLIGLTEVIDTPPNQNSVNQEDTANKKQEKNIIVWEETLLQTTNSEYKDLYIPLYPFLFNTNNKTYHLETVLDNKKLVFSLIDLDENEVTFKKDFPLTGMDTFDIVSVGHDGLLWDRVFSQDENGKLFAYLIQYNLDGQELQKVKIDGSPHINLIRENETHLFTVTHEEQLIIYNKLGEQEKKYDNFNDFEVDTSHYYTSFRTSDMGDSTVARYDSKHNLVTKTSLAGLGNHISVNDKYIYAIVGDEIKRMNKDLLGKWESFFSFPIEINHRFTDNMQYSIDDFVVNNDETIYLKVRESQDYNTTKIYKIKSSVQTISISTENIVITTPYIQDKLARGAILYNKINPEINITFDCQYDSYDEFLKNADIYGEQIAARILTGDIGDIVHTGGAGFDYLNIADKDVFLDLTNYIENSEEKENWYPVATKGLKLYDEIKGLPLDFAYSYYYVNDTLAKEHKIMINDNLTWNNIFDMCDTLSNNNSSDVIFTDTDSKNITHDIITSNIYNLVNMEEKKIMLRQDWFLELLEHYKQAYQTNNLYTTGQNDFKSSSNFSSLFMERSRFQDSLAIFSDQVSWTSRYNKGIIPTPKGENSNHVIGISRTIYSINSTTKYPKECYDFLEFCMSEKVQQDGSSLGGESINRNILINNKNNAIANYTFSENSDLPLSQQEKNNKNMSDTNDYFEIFSPFNESINKLTYPSIYVNEFTEPIDAYLTNKISLDQALAQIESAIMFKMVE